MYHSVVSEPESLKMDDLKKETISEAELKNNIEKDFNLATVASKAQNWSSCVTHLSKTIDSFRQYDRIISSCPLEAKNDVKLEKDWNTVELERDLNSQVGKSEAYAWINVIHYRNNLKRCMKH